MSLLSALRTTASGLTAQRLRLDVIANNIANAETTRTEGGGPYRQASVVFTPREEGRPFRLPSLVRRSSLRTRSMPAGGVQVAAIIADDKPGTQVYDPDHPDADEDGFVTYPNVNLVTEMTDLLSATRSYEANVTVLNAVKQMALRALDIGRS